MQDNSSQIKIMLMIAIECTCKAWLMIVYQINKQDTMSAPEQKHTYTVRGLNFKGLIFYDLYLNFSLNFSLNFPFNFSLNSRIENFFLKFVYYTGNGIHYG